jgi:hypothetical protein
MAKMPGAEAATDKEVGSEGTPRYCATIVALDIPSAANGATAFICESDTYRRGDGTPFTNTCTPPAVDGSRPPEIAGIIGVLGPSPAPKIEKRRPGANAGGKKKLALLTTPDIRGSTS